MPEDKTIIVENGGGGGAIVALILGIIVVLVALYVIFGTNLLSGVTHHVSADVTVTTPAKP